METNIIRNKFEKELQNTDKPLSLLIYEEKSLEFPSNGEGISVLLYVIFHSLSAQQLFIGFCEE